MKNITLGCDPELFLYDTEKEEYVSAEGILNGKGSKEDPLIVAGKFFTLQEDNVALEYTIEPANSVTEFVENNLFMMEVIKEITPDKFEFHNVSSVEIPWKYLGSKQSMEAGCIEDFNAWTGLENPEVKIDKTNLRSAGGHIHIGVDLPRNELLQLVKKLDVLVGVPSIIIDPDNRRRKIYGRAGAHRIAEEKYKGVEWRVPSNFWVQPDRLAWMYNAVMTAIDTDITPEQYNEAIEIINTADVVRAYDFCNKLKLCADFMAIAEQNAPIEQNL